MERLIESKLFGAGLVPIDTPAMVARYNRCLAGLGIEPTALESFAIDGMGWSPAIADEKRDLLYLSAGIANPMAVIATPDQADKPLYSPYNSYDRALMRLYFDKFRAEIADITRTACIGLDIDQELTSYRNPLDLLLVRYIVVRSSAGELTAAGKHQQDLVARVMNEELAWNDAALRREIADSARQLGDLRFRRIEIPDLQVPVGSFYTRAFGGVFVLRELKGSCDLMILEDQSLLPSVSLECQPFWLRDPALPDKLASAGLVEFDPDWYRRHPEVLEDKRNALTAELIGAQDPEADLVRLTEPQKKRKLAQSSGPRLELLQELERIAMRIESGADEWKILPTPALKLRLYRPAQKLPDEVQEVVWLLLCRMTRLDVVRLYMTDKNLFYEEYRGWPANKKEWAIALIRERYDAVSKAGEPKGA